MRRCWALIRASPGLSRCGACRHRGDNLQGLRYHPGLKSRRILITHWQNSIHKDHRNAHQIARGLACAGLQGIERTAPSHWVNRMYYSENWEDMEAYEPDVYVDTSAVFEQYCEALSPLRAMERRDRLALRGLLQEPCRMRACLGFGNGAQYGATLACPKGETVVRVRDVP